VNDSRQLDVLWGLFEEATAAARSDEEARRGIVTVMRGYAVLPCAATLVGTPVTVESIDDSGARIGITSSVVRRNRRYRVGILAIEFPEHLEIRDCQEAYRRWAEGKPIRPSPDRRRREAAPAPTVAAEPTEQVVVFAVRRSQAACRFLRSGEDASLRMSTSELGQIIPGEVLTIAVRKRWTYGARLHVSAKLVSHAFDVHRLQIDPLGLEHQGEFDPREAIDEQREGSEEPYIPDCYLPILAAGVRPEFEMDQVIPGCDVAGDDDPVVEAAEAANRGDFAEAERILMDLLAEDIRCVDAFAHLGYMHLDKDAETALRYYRAGAEIAELSFPPGFNGVLSWGHVDNRPYLRCLHGAGLCQWRVGRLEEAQETFERLLWLDPRDSQGATVLIESVRAGELWRPD
jgi:hypothetical protein